MAVQALIFDVFGTCVDWRNSVAREVAAMMPGVNALEFATLWRAQYDPAMARVRDGERGYVPLDDLHMENLHIVCKDLGVTCPDPARLNQAWEHLSPWDDVPPALNALRRQFLIAPCSNGSIAMMARLARFAQLPWDCILGAEIARNYKPHPSVYLASCAALRLNPDEVMMVAAHNGDLTAAREAGLATAFVPRTTEHGPDQDTDLDPTDAWDVVAHDFSNLANQLDELK